MLQQEARRTSWKNLINTISGCSAVGSALGLGVRVFKNSQSFKVLKTLDFVGVFRPRYHFGKFFYHNLSTSRKLNILHYRGVAQLVARLVWDQDAGGSNPFTPTKKAQESMFLSLFSIYEGWRKPSALALYDHPNKLEFVYLSNLQISTLKRYLLTHSPFSIGQQRFPASRN